MDDLNHVFFILQAAFLLPTLTAMVQRGLTTDGHQEVQTPQAICVAPTRELALQIYNDCRKFAYETDVRAVVLYGGTSMGYQLRQVENGANFVIGTPGRLLDVINRGKVNQFCVFIFFVCVGGLVHVNATITDFSDILISKYIYLFEFVLIFI